MATKTVVNISPKVLTGGLCGLGVAVAEGIMAAITPHTLDFLGQWEPFALAALPPLLGQAAAWFKKEQAEEAPPVIGGSVQTAPAATTDPVGWVGDAPAVDAPPAQTTPLAPPTSL